MNNNVIHIIWISPQQYNDIERNRNYLAAESGDLIITEKNENIVVL